MTSCPGSGRLPLQGGRFFPAVCMALLLHAALLALPLPEQSTIIPPHPRSLQHLAVSLGARPASPEEPAVAVAEPVDEPPLPAPEPAPVPAPSLSPAHVRKSVSPPAPKNRAQPVLQATARKRVVSRPSVPAPAVASPQVVARVQARNSPSPAGVLPESDRKNLPATAAARVVHEASPLYRVNPPPEYPRLARRRGYQGLVILEVLVDAQGRALEVRVVTGSGHALLDKAALRAVQSWRFSPGTINGVPQRMRVRVPVRFRLDS